MKKVIKPFDFEAAKNGANVETRNGYKVTLAEEREPYKDGDKVKVIIKPQKGE